MRDTTDVQEDAFESQKAERDALPRKGVIYKTGGPETDGESNSTTFFVFSGPVVDRSADGAGCVTPDARGCFNVLHLASVTRDGEISTQIVERSVSFPPAPAVDLDGEVRRAFSEATDDDLYWLLSHILREDIDNYARFYHELSEMMRKGVLLDYHGLWLDALAVRVEGSRW